MSCADGYRGSEPEDCFLFGETFSPPRLCFPLFPRRQEVRVAVSDRSRSRGLVCAERKDLGSRVGRGLASLAWNSPLMKSDS